MSKVYDAKTYVKTRLAYDWWKYVALIVVVCLLWYYAFYMTDRLKDTEKIQIFTSAEIVNFDIEKELEDEFSKQGIYDYFFYQASFENKNFEFALETQGFGNSDILIIPEEALTEAMLAQCVVFDDEFINACKTVNEKVVFVQSEEKTYGIKIYVKDDDEYNNGFSFSSWMNPDRNYCMVLSKQSKNVGRLSSESKAENDKALSTYIYLLGRK